MRSIALFLWLALPIAGYATLLAFGTPHMIWSYRFVPNGDPHNPFAARHYTSCTYAGWRWHEVTVQASEGRCDWVRFFHQ
tara:strand:- start:8025 stop:8264 length:240 start_codon:yes stop_codon:yes gene_type:complete